MSATPIEAVLLDVGGVLLLPDPASLLAEVHAAGATGVTAPALARGHYAGTAAMDRAALASDVLDSDVLDRGVTADWRAYHRALVASLGVGDDLADAVTAAVARAYAALRWTAPVPGSMDGLRRLAATGVALAVVSNSDGTAEELLLTSRICQVGAGEGVPVVVVLDSAVVGIEKPDPAIFHRALHALGVEPRHALHVGDTGWADIAGARAAGVRPVHVDPHGFCPVPDDHDHVVDLDGVVALVAAAGCPAGQ